MRDFLVLMAIALILAGGYGYHHNPKECQKLGLDVVADTKAIFVPPDSSKAPADASPVATVAPSVAAVSPNSTPSVPVVAPSPAPAVAVVSLTPPPQHYSVGFVAQADAPPRAAISSANPTPAATPSPAMSPQHSNLPTFTDYDDALTAARSNHVPLLILFTGSDWCQYCKMLEQEVLSDSGFQKYISNHYVFLTIDDLRNSPVSDDDKQKVQSLEQKFKVGGFPSLIMIDDDEHEKDRIEGYNPGSGPSAVMSELDQIAQKPGHA
jgi:thioredoxin-related protein